MRCDIPIRSHFFTASFCTQGKKSIFLRHKSATKDAMFSHTIKSLQIETAFVSKYTQVCNIEFNFFFEQNVRRKRARLPFQDAGSNLARCSQTCRGRPSRRGRPRWSAEGPPGTWKQNTYFYIKKIGAPSFATYTRTTYQNFFSRPTSPVPPLVLAICVALLFANPCFDSRALCTRKKWKNPLFFHTAPDFPHSPPLLLPCFLNFSRI